MGVQVPVVPSPEPSGSADAWYADDVHDQYEVVPGVVATVRDGDDGFVYAVREPSLSAAARTDLGAIREHADEYKHVSMADLMTLRDPTAETCS